jgi:trans-aconitate methyltransferase
LRGNYRLTLRADLVTDLLGDTTGKRIVDLGCGDGSVSAGLAGSLTLIDRSREMIDEARRRTGDRATYRCGDLHEVEPDNFDIALCIGVLAHVDDTNRTIQAAHRCLRSGGLLVLQLTDYSQALGKLNSFLVSLSGKLQYRPTTMSDVLSAARGFELLDCRRHFLVPAGMHRLCGSALVPIERAVLKQPWLARHGADAMLLLRKHHFTE